MHIKGIAACAAIAFASLIAGAGSGFAQEEKPPAGLEDFLKLKSSFEAAHERVTEPVRGLNGKYLEALERLMKQVSSTGNLQGAVQIKDEMAAFGDGSDFEEREFLKRKTENEELERMRSTYLSQRDDTIKDLKQAEADLFRKYREELTRMEAEKTRASFIDAALVVRDEKKSLASRGFAGNTGASFKGKIHFVSKAEVKIRLNGKEVRFDNDTDKEHYITAVTEEVEFKPGDIIQLDFISIASFRGHIMALQSTDGAIVIPGRRTDYRKLETRGKLKTATPEEILALPTIPDPGPVDEEMRPFWSNHQVSSPGKEACEWIKIDVRDEWNYYAFVLREDMFSAESD